MVVGYRHHAAGAAVHDGDRAAPVALARHAPVVEPVVDPSRAPAGLLQPVRHAVEALAEGEPRVLAGVDDDGVLLVGPGGDLDVHLGVVGGGDDLADGKSEPERELVVALVVAGHGHDRAGAVAHEHEVRDPHRQALAVERVDRVHAERHAALLHRLQLGRRGAAVPALLDERGDVVAPFRDRRGERVLGRHRHERRAVHGVGAGGEDAKRRLLAVLRGGFDPEVDVRALGAADPVALHGLDRLGPVDVVELVEQLLAVVGDAQEPLRDLAPLDHRARAPAAPVDDLLVGEHGLVHGVPVHLGLAAVGDPLLEQPGEQPLLPAVVLRPAGGELAAPVVGEPELTELRLHVLDVLVGPARGRHPVLHGRVLGGQSERVPSHGLEDVAPAHALVPADHVADGVVAHVPHVQLPARVREHRQAVELLAGGVFPDLEHAVLVPEGLRLVLYRLGEVAFVHRRSIVASVAARDDSKIGVIEWCAVMREDCPRGMHCEGGIPGSVVTVRSRPHDGRAATGGRPEGPNGRPFAEILRNRSQTPTWRRTFDPCAGPPPPVVCGIEAGVGMTGQRRDSLCTRTRPKIGNRSATDLGIRRRAEDKP